MGELIGVLRLIGVMSLAFVSGMILQHFKYRYGKWPKRKKDTNGD